METAPRIGGTSADFDDKILSVTKNIGVRTALHGLLASLGVTPPSLHHDVGDRSALTRGSFGRVTHNKCMTPDTAPLRSTVRDTTPVDESVGSGEGGSRSNRDARMPFNRGPGKGPQHV